MHFTSHTLGDGFVERDFSLPAEKTLHANPGNHRHVPAFESDDSARFFAHHLVTS